MSFFLDQGYKPTAVVYIRATLGTSIHYYTITLLVFLLYSPLILCLERKPAFITILV